MSRWICPNSPMKPWCIFAVAHEHKGRLNAASPILRSIQRPEKQRITTSFLSWVVQLFAQKRGAFEHFQRPVRYPVQSKHVGWKWPTLCNGPTTRNCRRFDICPKSFRIPRKSMSTGFQKGSEHTRYNPQLLQVHGQSWHSWLMRLWLLPSLCIPRVSRLF